MSLEMHAKHMNRTSDYAWRKYIEKSQFQDVYHNSKGTKEERINNLSRENFYNEFMKKYSNVKLSFVDESEKKYNLDFKGIKFKSNGANYDVLFDLKDSDVFDFVAGFWINGEFQRDDLDKYCILDSQLRKVSKKLVELTDDSKEIVKEMFSYQ